MKIKGGGGSVVKNKFQENLKSLLPSMKMKELYNKIILKKHSLQGPILSALKYPTDNGHFHS